MPNEIKEYAQALRVMLLSVFKNVVRPFRVVHEAKASHYENVEAKGDKRSKVDLDRNLKCDCEVLLFC